MSLISGSIAHTAFGGLGISYFLNQNPLCGALMFSALAAVLINFVRIKAQKRMDSLLSTFWAVGMSIGLIFIFLTPGYAADLFTYLFGNILLVDSSDLVLMFVFDVIILLAVFLFYNVFLAAAFDEEYATVRNIPVSFTYLILFLLIALTVVLVIRIVGIVLMIALLTIPAATAHLLTKTVKKMMIISSLITLFVTIAGLLISYYINFPTGPIIVLLAAIIYGAVIFSQYKKHTLQVS